MYVNVSGLLVRLFASWTIVHGSFPVMLYSHLALTLPAPPLNVPVIENGFSSIHTS